MAGKSRNTGILTLSKVSTASCRNENLRTQCHLCFDEPDYILERFDAASIELFIEDVNGCKKHLLGLNLKHSTIRYAVNGAPDHPVEKAEGYVRMPAKPSVLEQSRVHQEA